MSNCVESAGSMCRLYLFSLLRKRFEICIYVREWNKEYVEKKGIWEREDGFPEWMIECARYHCERREGKTALLQSTTGIVGKWIRVTMKARFILISTIRKEKPQSHSHEQKRLQRRNQCSIAILLQIIWQSWLKDRIPNSIEHLLRKLQIAEC